MHILRIISNNMHGTDRDTGYYRAADRQLFEAVVARAENVFDVVIEEEVAGATPNYRAQGLAWQALGDDFPGVEALLPKDLRLPTIY